MWCTIYCCSCWSVATSASIFKLTNLHRRFNTTAKWPMLFRRRESGGNATACLLRGILAETFVCLELCYARGLISLYFPYTTLYIQVTMNYFTPDKGCISGSPRLFLSSFSIRLITEPILLYGSVKLMYIKTTPKLRPLRYQDYHFKVPFH